MTITPKAAIEKGKDLENHVARQIAEKGIDPRATRSHGSGSSNREKSDIWTTMQVLDRQAGIECKHTTVTSIPQWWKQTKKLESLGYEPILVFKNTHETYDGTKVVIYFDTFLDLVKAANGAEPIINVGISQDDRDRKYKLERAKQALAEAIKVL